MERVEIQLLHRHCDDNYDAEYDGDIDYVESGGHFESLCEWAASHFGYRVKEWTSVYEVRYDDGEWFDFNCKALGKSFKARIDEDEAYGNYLMHAIVERPSWSIEDDGTIKNDKINQFVLCFSDDNEEIVIEQHAPKKCPYWLYYDEVYKRVKYRVDVSYYVEAEAADVNDDLDFYVERGIHDYLDDTDCLQERVREQIEDNVDPDIYYNGDVTVYRHKMKVKALQR